jgi:hypothetical protein
MVRDAPRSLSSGRASRGPGGGAPHHEAERVPRALRAFHLDKLHRSRGAMRPSFAPRLPPGRGLAPASCEARGDGAPSGAACPFSARLFIGGAAPFGAPSGVLARRRAALPAGSSPAASELLAGGRSAPGRSPGAARAREPAALTPAGAGPDPASRRNRFASPHGAGHSDYIPIRGGGDKYCGKRGI